MAGERHWPSRARGCDKLSAATGLSAPQLGTVSPDSGNVGRREWGCLDTMFILEVIYIWP